MCATEAVDADLALRTVGGADAFDTAVSVAVRRAGSGVAGTWGASIARILASALAEAEGDVTGLAIATLRILEALDALAELGVQVRRIARAVFWRLVDTGRFLALASRGVAELACGAGVGLVGLGGADLDALEGRGVTGLGRTTGHLVTRGDRVLDTCVGLLVAGEAFGTLARVTDALVGVVAGLLGTALRVIGAAGLAQPVLFVANLTLGALAIIEAAWAARSRVEANLAARAVEVRRAHRGRSDALACEHVTDLALGAVLARLAGCFGAQAIDTAQTARTFTVLDALGLGAGALAVGVGVANLAIEAEITGDRTADAVLEQADLPQTAIAVERTWGVFGLCDIPGATTCEPQCRAHQGGHGQAKPPRALCECIHHLLFSSLDVQTAHVRRRFHHV